MEKSRKSEDEMARIRKGKEKIKCTIGRIIKSKRAQCATDNTKGKPKEEK
ncbi:hypothetical protein K5X82_17755 [Halosquirtibacter xylanolyticus]|nr:hypothetical protein K5X82_17755 [Prolixibacteraceae bacterium]